MFWKLIAFAGIKISSGFAGTSSLDLNQQYKHQQHVDHTSFWGITPDIV